MSRREMPMKNGVRFEFKPQDCWVGAYWHRNGPMLDVWICLLPMLPLHIRRFRIRPLPEPMDLTDEEAEAFLAALEDH